MFKLFAVVVLFFVGDFRWIASVASTKHVGAAASTARYFSKTTNPSFPPASVRKLLQGKIKHVVVLMEENRSFDHFFGWGETAGLEVNGLTGKETNPLNETDPHSPEIAVDKRAPFINLCDPDHSTPGTTRKIFGSGKGNLSDPTMKGFVGVESGKKHAVSKDFCNVMSAFTPDRLPVITALAKEFALFDNFFCSHPGPTWPNRLYALTGTSLGMTETGTWFRDVPGQLFPQPTIFDQLSFANLTWRNYYNDTPWELFLESVAHQPDNTRPLTEFFEAASSGNLPSFAWINPQLGINITTGVGSNDQHPDHDVHAGEQLYKAVYEALRAGPAWNDTLFVITFDEHGGFFDHVPPPSDGVPSPEFPPTPSYPDPGFAYDRLGVRIPTLLISPYIPKGTVISAPPAAQRPYPSSQYELTSILSTTRLLLGVPNQPLTRRDEWSATFEHVFEKLHTPRVDCPMHLPDAIPPETKHLVREANLPLNDLQHHVLTVHAHLGNASAHTEDGVSMQRHVGPWASKVLAAHKERKRHELIGRAVFRDDMLVVATATNKEGGYTILENKWSCANTPRKGSIPWTTIATGKLKNAANVSLCLDYSGNRVSLMPCGNGDGSHPGDPYQRWIIDPGDATVHAWPDTHLCLTAHENDDPSQYRSLVRPMTIEPCVNDVRQSMAFGGVALGGSDGPTVTLNFGNMALCVVTNQTSTRGTHLRTQKTE